jgi:hypothetical protein
MQKQRKVKMLLYDPPPIKTAFIKTERQMMSLLAMLTVPIPNVTFSIRIHTTRKEVSCR